MGREKDKLRGRDRKRGGGWERGRGWKRGRGRDWGRGWNWGRGKGRLTDTNVGQQPVIAVLGIVPAGTGRDSKL